MGCDCAGLVLGVWRALIGPWPEPLPPYTPDWAEATGEEIMYGMARRHMTEIPAAAARPGDLLLFRMVRHEPARHCAVLSGPDLMIHAFSGDEVREEHLRQAWKRPLVHAFRLPQTA